jgi:hypothetical protein
MRAVLVTRSFASAVINMMIIDPCTAHVQDALKATMLSNLNSLKSSRALKLQLGLSEAVCNSELECCFALPRLPPMTDRCSSFPPIFGTVAGAPATQKRLALLFAAALETGASVSLMDGLHDDHHVRENMPRLETQREGK